ncbi:hypothetical protein KI387_035996, partial [Taxus chinensis]
MDYESQLKVGQYAEICKWDGRSSNSWIEAKILDIEWANGRAQFHISFIDENGKGKNLIIDEGYTKCLPFDENGALIRPRPPSKVYCNSESGESVAHPLFKDNWQAGDAVEVHYGNYWRPGRVVEMSCTKEKMIYFYNGSNIKVDSSMEIRAQVTWTGKSWFLVNNEAPQIGAKGSFKNKFKPYVGEGLLSPNREVVTEFVRNIFTEHPSFARAIQRKCLGRNGKMSFPVMFMTNYLSGSEGTVTFEDSDGIAWTVGWSAYMQSGRRLLFTTGWPEFASYHNAKDGDVLLVEILNPNHFRAQILPTESGMCTNKNVLYERAVTEVVSTINDISDRGAKEFWPSAPLQIFQKRVGNIEHGIKTREKKPTYFSHGSCGTPQQIHGKQNICGRKADVDCSQYTIGDSQCDGRNKCTKFEGASNLTEALVDKQKIVSGSRQTDSALLSIKRGLLRSDTPEFGIDLKSCFYPPSSNSGFQHAFTGGRQYVASFCQSSAEKCSQYVFCGFLFCMLHILEDPSAPYKQCDFILLNSSQRCRFPVSLCVADTRFCQIHKQMVMPNLRLVDTSHQENPCCGRLSLLVLAATVAHDHLECFGPQKTGETKKINLADDGIGARPVPEVMLSSPLNTSSVNVLHKQLHQACEDGPSDVRPGKDFPAREKVGCYSSGIAEKVQSNHQKGLCDSPVQYGMKASESNNTSESIKDESDGSGTNVMKRGRFQQSHDSTLYKDISSGHVEQGCTERVECGVLSQMMDIESTGRDMQIKGTLFEKEMFEGSKSCPNVIVGTPKNMFKEGTCQ